MPKWQILMVRSGQPETLLEASKAWSWEQRLSARMSFSLVYHAMLNDLMRRGTPRRVYSHNFAGAALCAHAWRTHDNVCLYATSVTFDGTLPAPDSCAGLDALAYEAFDQTSVSVITCFDKTWIFQQMQGDPILSPLLATRDGIDGTSGGGGFCEDGVSLAYGEKAPDNLGHAFETETTGAISDNAAWLDAWLLGQHPAPSQKLRKKPVRRSPRRSNGQN